MPRRSSQSPFLNLPLLIIILPTVAILIILFFAFPYLPSQRNHRPSTTTTSNSTVKKGWDSLNVSLVLFGILCGLLAKRNDDESNNRHSAAESNELNDTNTNREELQNQWFDQSLTGTTTWDNPTPLRRLKRNSSSYPDLRQESLLETNNYRLRFFDDIEISKYRQLQAASVTGNPPLEKEIPVDTFVLHSTPPRRSPPVPPPPPLSMTPNLKPKRYNNIVSRREAEIKDKSPPPPPPPPLPPPMPAASKAGQSERRNERKRNNATKEIKMVLASLYNSRRKRKRKPKTINFVSQPEVSISAQSPPTLPPPPPPPPPPPSVFHSLFRKGGKSKRIQSSAPPPPPPPPLPVSRRKVNAPPPAPPPPAPRKPPPENSNRRRSSSSWRPPLPSAARAHTLLDDYEISSGGQSPLIPMPPPPPPPPFKVPGFRFVVKGDFVKVRSANSSRCSSPELEESTEEVNSMDGGGDDGGGGPLYCASPDVNVKADTFIARFWDGRRLENVNSMKRRDHLGFGPDYLGPGPS